MGQITVDQSHQVMAALATNANWAEIDFQESGLQDLIIRDAMEAGRQFTEFLKNGARMPADGKDNSNRFLKFISPEPLIIGPANGSEILADAGDVFTGGIDSNFRRWKADKPGASTEKTPADVYEMAKNANFTQMFGSLSADLNRLCLTQAQIIGFAGQHRDWLRADSYATFFLFKSYEQFFVARVYVDSGGRLGVNVSRFGHSYLWGAGCRHRLVAPRLA